MRTIKAALIFILISSPVFAINVHELNGSDLGMGVGARAMSMGGAFTALADDTSALFWNPAGITEIKNNEDMLMADVDPARYSFKGIVMRPEEWNKSKSRLTVGVSRTNRLKFIADGDWSEGNANHLIDLSMISVEHDYVGGLNSRTKDWRYTIAGRIPGYDRLSMGVSYIDFNCVTTFYMVNPGRVCQRTAYETFDFGMLYRKSEKKHFALLLRNPVEPSKPKYITIGAAWFRGRDTFTVDLEHIYGNYSNEKRKCDFIMLRSGVERDYGSGWKLRGGLVIPVRARTSTLGNIMPHIPSPKFGGAIGAGYTFKNYTLDYVLFGDPGKSYIVNKAVLSSALTLSHTF
jgi:hypothetical protein